jgi:hypothetical protein
MAAPVRVNALRKPVAATAPVAAITALPAQNGAGPQIS